MIGKGIFGKPWLFADLAKRKEAFKNKTEYKETELSLGEKLRISIRHARLFEKYLGFKNFAIMKKHFKAYCSDFDNAKELREKLFACNNTDELEKEIETFLSSR